MDAADRMVDLQEALRAKAMAVPHIAPGRRPSLWYCEDCLEAIPEARRLALPSCTRCIACQAMVEGHR